MAVQTNVDAVINDLVPIPFLDGALVTATIQNAATTVAHTLARQPRGWFVTDRVANAGIWRTAWDSRTITLQSSAANTAITFWVF